EKILAAEHLYVRTEQHPVVEQLRKKGINISSFDFLYEQFDVFDEVYEGIADALIQKSEQEKSILFVVPGHPFVAEQTTQLLIKKGNRLGIEVVVREGSSFLDPMFSALKIDPAEGFTLLDALRLDKSQLNPQLHVIITQVYDDLTASDVKLTLMD